MRLVYLAEKPRDHDHANLERPSARQPAKTVLGSPNILV
jgi:hypothetical protein